MDREFDRTTFGFFVVAILVFAGAAGFMVYLAWTFYWMEAPWWLTAIMGTCAVYYFIKGVQTWDGLKREWRLRRR